MGETHLIRNDQEALKIADRFARQIEAESAGRNDYRRLPFQEMELFSEVADVVAVMRNHTIAVGRFVSLSVK